MYMRYLKRNAQTILLALIGVLIAGAIAIYLTIFADLPSISQIDAGLALPSTHIYDRHGELLYEILPPEQGRNRVISLDEIPDVCINAVIAVEDANYWTHPGVDPVGIARALWINLNGGEIIAGGSTITQQTARLLLLDSEERATRSVRRKLREMVLAVQMQNQFSKAHVLELYLNQVYFGNLAYGIEAAARTYFHKSASELSTAECALLAGIIQNPIVHDPLTRLDSALNRQQVALDLMVERGYLSVADARATRNDQLQFGSTRFPIEAPHFVMTVWQQLQQRYPDALYTRGLDVTTTLDLGWQRIAENTVTYQLGLLNDTRDGQSANANNASLIALDPHNGQVLTMLGSPDYFDETIDGAVNATLALRQPGSTLKPFTYALAMNPQSVAPYTPATVLLDVRTPFITERLESYTPGNFALVEHGPVSIREALGSSYNIPAVVALEHVGVNHFIEFVADAGLDSLASAPNLDLAVTLGGGEVRLLDLAQAYSIFSNGGYYVEPQFLLNVSTRDGEALYTYNEPRLENRVLDERVAWLITDMLSDNQARIPGFGVNNLLQIGRPSGAKTGTTTDFRDNWVMGYTPNLVVGVWVGNADNTPMIDVTGISGAGPIYNQFFRQIMVGQPVLDFPRPEGIVRAEVCTLSGLLPSENCPLRRLEWFIEGTVPTDYDNVYRTFAIDTRTGELATQDTPDEYMRQQTFAVLPRQARDWAVMNGIDLPPTGASQYDTVTDVRILAPDPYTNFERSPLTPRETQRIRFSVATPEDTISVQYVINGEPYQISEHDPFDVWWTLDVGTWELRAQATLADGTTYTSEAITFTVVDYQPAQPRTITQGAD
ncbi:MAG: penicillin-binding protein 1C [Anaerolineae bacterium]